MTRVLEGTWAEIAAHEDEWEGKKLRVTISEATEPPDAPPRPGEPTLADVMGDLVGQVSFLPDDLSENTGEKFNAKRSVGISPALLFALLRSKLRSKTF